jgi:nucleoside-diphosphate-sugar epimerase
MNVVILGFTGTIGQYSLKYFIENTNFNLICVGRDLSQKLIKHNKIKYFKWDFINFQKSNLFFLKDADIVINCVGKNNDKLHDTEYINSIFLKKFIKHLNANALKLRLIHLSSVAVYGEPNNYFNQTKILKENNRLIADNLYSKSKLKAEMLIRNTIKNKNISFTILRISNVFGGEKNSNLYNFFLFSLKVGFWIKSSNDVMFNFVNVKDVCQAINLTILNLNSSLNKTYNISDDCEQLRVYKFFQTHHKKKIRKISIPIFLIDKIINYFFLPKKLKNFFFMISSKISYSNEKIKKELNFQPRYSLVKNLKSFK